MTTLVSLIIIDKVQPQTAGYLTVASRTGLATRPGSALASFTLMPSVAAEQVMDIALKHSDVRLAFLQLDSRVGFVVLQSHSVSELKGAVDAIVHDMNLSVPPDIIKTAHARLVAKLDPNQAYVTNKTRMGSLCIPGDSLHVFECDPSGYALLAVNEAEKAADIRIVDFKFTGSMGRVIISGTASNVRAAEDAVSGAAEVAA